MPDSHESPGRTGAARHGVDPGVVPDPPRRGDRDRVVEPDQLALHTPVHPHAGFKVADLLTIRSARKMSSNCIPQQGWLLARPSHCFSVAKTDQSLNM
jgi:hypothetical protein